MQANGAQPAQGLSARADLLRLLAVAPRACLVLDQTDSDGLAYVEQPAIAKEIPAITADSTDTTRQAFTPTSAKLPLKMPFVHVIAERKTLESTQSGATNTQPVPVFEPINEQDAQAPFAKRQVNYQDLIPKARLLPALKRHVACDRYGGLDMPQLVKQVAGQQLPRRLPRSRLKTWHPQWVVVLDFCDRLWPYRQDMHRLAEQLCKHCGESGISLRVINHGPFNQWTDWLEEQRSRGPLPESHPWRMPTAATPVLLVSDLGLLHGADSAIHQQWQVFIEQLLRAQTQAWALLPLGAEQLDHRVPKALQLLRWSPDARMHPARPHGPAKPQPDGLQDLLAMAAITRRVDPPQLRAMRQLNPREPLNAGLEGAFWCHADVDAGSAAQIRQSAQDVHLQLFNQQLTHLHVVLEALRFQHHGHLRAVLNHEESLLWAAHAAESSTESEKRVQDAEKFMRQLAATLTHPDSAAKAGVWWQVAQDLAQRADQHMGQHYRDLLAPLVRAIVQVRGQWQNLPDYIAPSDIHNPNETGQPYWLVRDPRSHSVLLQDQPPQAQQSALGEPILIDSGGLRITSAEGSRWLPKPTQPLRICGLQQQGVIKLTASREVVTVASVDRPRGAVGWQVNNQGIGIRTAPFCGVAQDWNDAEWDVKQSKESFEFYFDRKPFVDQTNDWKMYQRTGKLSGQIGDRSYQFVSVKFELDEYGVYARLTIASEANIINIEQTFRWIEPGTFLMGSPNDEAERFSDEGPQHPVTLSHGFWLADTTCTQALWQAVMGNNPSRFNDDVNKPVEQVSWHDVQNFLQQLQRLLPDCQVDLPSEAEWEYACRAGTTTPFSFGNNISPQQVNYDGNFPYTGGETGEYRETTVEVKSLPANPWGLYEMHGNVLEWCKDGRRTYDGQPQIDPLGPQGQEEYRSIRGGSWSTLARRARSAIRDDCRPVNAGHDLGFRVCLRSIQPSPVSPAGSPGSSPTGLGG